MLNDCRAESASPRATASTSTRSAHMKIAILLFLFSSTCRAAEKPKVIKWQSGDACCKVVFSDGVAYERFSSSSILIDVHAPRVYDKHTDYVIVGVINSTGADLDVDPANWRAEAGDSASTDMPEVNADRLLTNDERKDRRRQMIGNALAGFGAGMQTRTATVNNSDGSASTVTYKDPTDVQNVNASAAASAASLSGHYARMSSAVLRRNTVRTGEFVIGSVYFDRPKHLNKKTTIGNVALTIGDTIYVFPYKDGGVPK
jgi:hypothetical protein